jgi:hypothetical protein
MGECKAALNIRGEHFQCDMDAPHVGWGHGSRAAEAIWLGADEQVPYVPKPGFWTRLGACLTGSPLRGDPDF